jgi:hypothetical protein
MKLLKAVFYGIIMAVSFVSCTLKFKPWKTIQYRDEFLYELSPSDGIPDKNKYKDYFIDTVFVKIQSQPEREHFEYETYNSFFIHIDYCMYDINEVKNIIIHNIKIETKRGRDYSYILSENYPINFLVKNIGGLVDISDHSRMQLFHNPWNEKKNYYEGIYYNDLFIEFGNTIEEFLIVLDTEIIFYNRQERREIKFKIIPKIEKGLFRWVRTGPPLYQ